MQSFTRPVMASRHAQEMYMPSKHVVLLAEDDEVTREMCAFNLERAGFDVLHAADGLEAIRVLAARRVDLVISDINMPNMDGFKLYREMKETEKNRETPFLFLTSRTSTEDQLHALRLGAYDYLSKPMDMEIFTLKVRGLLNHFKRAEGSGEKDPLTGMLNRCSLENALGRELDQVRLAGGQLVIALLRIMDFDKITATHGYGMGDRVLSYLARSVQSGLRLKDISGRYETADILLAFPDNSPEETMHSLRYISQNFRDQTPKELSEPLGFRAGLITARPHHFTLQDHILRAYAALEGCTCQTTACFCVWGENTSHVKGVR